MWYLTHTVKYDIWKGYFNVYFSPEMVEGKPYGEKADVWALGCILYQMCVLDPPFFSNNMLTLAKSVSINAVCFFFHKAYFMSSAH